MGDALVMWVVVKIAFIKDAFLGALNFLQENWVKIVERFLIGRKGEDVIVELKSTAKKFLTSLHWPGLGKGEGAGCWEGKCGKVDKRSGVA